MKKILITGANGLLGQKLVYMLLNDKNSQLIATSKGENRIVEKAGYSYEELDICNKNQVEKIFLKYLPDVVINTAAMTNVDACETQKEEAFLLNVTAVQNMIDVIQSAKNNLQNCQLLHLST
ncbi:MAG TPA: sugar nucleotide-binding protein, partial [Bacteroidia bacterium]|nr:sugar nucleotide-binding protein [Bacteroidia bacterium]